MVIYASGQFLGYLSNVTSKSSCVYTSGISIIRTGKSSTQEVCSLFSGKNDVLHLLGGSRGNGDKPQTLSDVKGEGNKMDRQLARIATQSAKRHTRFAKSFRS